MKFPNPFPFQSFKSQVTQLLLSTGQGEEAQLHLLRQHGRFQPPPLLQGEAPGSTLKMLKGKPLGGLRLGKSQWWLSLKSQENLFMGDEIGSSFQKKKKDISKV